MEISDTISEQSINPLDLEINLNNDNTLDISYESIDKKCFYISISQDDVNSMTSGFCSSLQELVQLFNEGIKDYQDISLSFDDQNRIKLSIKWSNSHIMNKKHEFFFQLQETESIIALMKKNKALASQVKDHKHQIATLEKKENKLSSKLSASEKKVEKLLEKLKDRDIQGKALENLHREVREESNLCEQVFDLTSCNRDLFKFSNDNKKVSFRGDKQFHKFIEIAKPISLENCKVSFRIRKSPDNQLMFGVIHESLRQTFSKCHNEDGFYAMSLKFQNIFHGAKVDDPQEYKEGSIITMKVDLSAKTIEWLHNGKYVHKLLIKELSEEEFYFMVYFRDEEDCVSIV